MAKSMLAAVREASLAGTAVDSAEADKTGATAPDATSRAARADKETGMSKEHPAGSAAGDAGIPNADHVNAVSEATETGRAEGAKAERERLAAVLSAEGIKGDGSRMAAALDLATKSPGMSAEDVTAFVTGNMPAADDGGTGGTDPKVYEAGRVAAAGLAAPTGQTGRRASINRSEIFESRRKATKEG